MLTKKGLAALGLQAGVNILGILLELFTVGRLEVRPNRHAVHGVLAGVVVVAEEGGGEGRQLQVVVLLRPGRDVGDRPVGEGGAVTRIEGKKQIKMSKNCLQTHTQVALK